MFKSKLTKFETDLKVRIRGKRLYPTESAKYLEVKIDANFSWQCQVNNLSVKINRTNALLFKTRKYVSPKILKSIFFAIFESHLSYWSLVWTQNFRTIQWILILQKRLLESLISNQGIPILVPYLNKTLFQNFKIKYAEKTFYLSTDRSTN